jgi:hypothetical protein
MEKRLTGRKVERLWLGVALCVIGLSPAASAQLGPTTLPEAPSTFKQSEAPVPRFWFPAHGEPPQQNDPQPANQKDSDRNFVGLIERGVRDQKEIFSAPLHYRNLKWDALFLVTTGGLIAADKQVSGAVSHGHVAISQHISDAGLYSTIAATGVLYLSGIARKDEHAREAGGLGLEALGNTFVVVAITQLIAGRERPLEGSGHGRFWVNNTFNRVSATVGAIYCLRHGRHGFCHTRHGLAALPRRRCRGRSIRILHWPSHLSRTFPLPQSRPHPTQLLGLTQRPGEFGGLRFSTVAIKWLKQFNTDYVSQNLGYALLAASAVAGLIRARRVTWGSKAPMLALAVSAGTVPNLAQLHWCGRPFGPPGSFRSVQV